MANLGPWHRPACLQSHRSLCSSAYLRHHVLHLPQDSTNSTFNILITTLHLSLIAFIIIANFVKGSIRNLTEPNGMASIFDAMVVVFFNHSGYHSVSNIKGEQH